MDPLALHAEVEKPDGTTIRFGSESAPDRMPQNIRFATKRMEGFDTASFDLPRHVLSESVDLELYDTARLVAGDGSVAYEGRVASLPRQLDDTHSVTVELQGWMAHARDRKFREIYVDRDLSRWGPPSVQRRTNLLATFGVTDPSVQPDATTGAPSLKTGFTGAWSAAPGLPLSESLYDAGPGVEIGSVYHAWKRASTAVSAVDTHWDWRVYLGTTDTLTSNDATATLRAAGPGTGTLTATTDDRRVAVVNLLYDTAAGSDGVEYAIFWTCLAVYGTHGLTKRGTATATEAQGFYVSDVIANIAARFAPKLSTAGIKDTSYVHPQIAFHERTDPYDAWLLLNAIHLWDLAVWENRTLHYGPVDLTDHDWEIRTDDYGVNLQQQGDTVDTLANGITVEFDNVNTGKKETVEPADHDELRDTSISHPANKHGLEVWQEVSLSIPTTQDMALQIGRTMLAEFNQPKAPGSITIKGGYVRDRQGNRQPAHKVRATDTIAIVDHPNDRPRLITETSWDDTSKTLTIATDSTIKRIDAFVDRVETQLRARNLSNA